MQAGERYFTREVPTFGGDLSLHATDQGLLIRFDWGSGPCVVIPLKGRVTMDDILRKLQQFQEMTATIAGLRCDPVTMTFQPLHPVPNATKTDPC